MKQVIVGGYNDALNYATTTPEYNCLMGGYTWDTTENKCYQCIPTGGTLGRLFVELSADPTNANSSYTFTVMIAGSPSAIVVVIAAGATTGNYLGAVDVVAGQTVSLRCVATATDPASAIASWTTQFEGTTAGESICLVNCWAQADATRYYEIQGKSDVGSTEVRVQSPIPTAGTFKKLYIQLSADPGTSPDAYTIALRVGGSSKNNTVTIVADNTSGNITNVTDVVAAGNLVNFIITPVSVPSVYPYAAIGIVFVSDINGESLIIGGSGGYQPDIYNTEYMNLCGTGGEDWSTTETSMYSLIQACTIRNLYVSLSAAPGAGNSYDISINKDGGAASGLTVHIHETDKTGNDTAHTYDPADGDTADIKCVPTSTPAATYVHIGLVAYISVAVNVTIDAVTATGDGTSLIPILNIGLNLLPPLATVSSGALIPLVDIVTIIEAVVAAAQAEGLIPVLSIGSTLLPLVASADVAGLIPAIQIHITLQPPLGIIDAQALTAILSTGVTITGVLGTISATGLTPTMSIGLTLLPPVATISSESLIPTIGCGVTISAPLTNADAVGLIADIITQWIKLHLSKRLVSLKLRERSKDLHLPKRLLQLHVREKP